MKILRHLAALLLCAGALILPAHAGTYQLTIAASLGASHAALGTAVGYTVYDSTGTIQIARTTSGIAESTDAASAPAGTYTATITMNTTWLPARVHWDATGQAGLCAESIVGADRASQIADGLTASRIANLDATVSSAKASADAVYTRIGAPAGASLAADVAALLTATNSNGTAIGALPSANTIVNALIAKQILGTYTLGQIWTAEGLLAFGASANTFHTDTHVLDSAYTLSGSSSTLTSHTTYGTSTTSIPQTSRTSTFAP